MDVPDGAGGVRAGRADVDAAVLGRLGRRPGAHPLTSKFTNSPAVARPRARPWTCKRLGRRPGAHPHTHPPTHKTHPQSGGLPPAIGWITTRNRVGVRPPARLSRRASARLRIHIACNHPHARPPARTPVEMHTCSLARAASEAGMRGGGRGGGRGGWGPGGGAGGQDAADPEAGPAAQGRPRVQVRHVRGHGGLKVFNNI